MVIPGHSVNVQLGVIRFLLLPLLSSFLPGLGPVDGTLGSCAGLDPCSSSYDDRPPYFVAPWQYDGSTAAALQALVDTLEVLTVQHSLQIQSVRGRQRMHFPRTGVGRQHAS